MITETHFTLTSNLDTKFKGAFDSCISHLSNFGTAVPFYLSRNAHILILALPKLKQARHHLSFSTCIQLSKIPRATVVFWEFSPQTFPPETNSFPPKVTWSSKTVFKHFSCTEKWAWQDLNLWPCAYQAHALTSWATGPIFWMSYFYFSSLFLAKLALNSLAQLCKNRLEWFERFEWWRQGDSNPWPIACKATALPTELCPLETLWRRFWF